MEFYTSCEGKALNKCLICNRFISKCIGENGKYEYEQASQGNLIKIYNLICSRQWTSEEEKELVRNKLKEWYNIDTNDDIMRTND
jgi:hypothetical protein